MSHQFMSIQPSARQGFDVIHKSYEMIYNGEYVKSKAAASVIESHNDKETAEAAAKKIAELKHLTFVPPDTSIITTIPFLKRSFLVVEIQTNGDVIGRGSVFNHEIFSAAEARDLAQRDGLSFVLPVL